MLTFDKNNQPTAYYYDFDPTKDSEYEKKYLNKIFHINNSDKTLRPVETDAKNRIPLIYIKYGVKETYENTSDLAFYDLIWPTLLQEKIYDNTGEEKEKQVYVDNGMNMRKGNFEALQKVGEEKGFSIIGNCDKYENFLGVDEYGSPNKPDKCNIGYDQQISDQTDIHKVVAKRIIWNLACKASQVGWFDKMNHEFAVRKPIEDPNKEDPESKKDQELGTEGPPGGDNQGSPGNGGGTSGGSPATEEFLKAITYKPEMFKLWRDMDWMNQKEKHDPTKKNAWTHALETEWSGTVNKVFFGAYLGKVSQHDKPAIEIGPVKMGAFGEGAAIGEDVFVTSDGLIKKLDDGAREHYLIEIHPESGRISIR